MEVAAPCLVLGKGDWEDRMFSSMLSSALVGQGLCAREAPAGAAIHPAHPLVCITRCPMKEDVPQDMLSYPAA